MGSIYVPLSWNSNRYVWQMIWGCRPGMGNNGGAEILLRFLRPPHRFSCKQFTSLHPEIGREKILGQTYITFHLVESYPVPYSSPVSVESMVKRIYIVK